MSYTGAVCGKAIAGLAVCGTDPRETAQDFAGYQLRYGDYILYDPRGANETDRLCASAASVDLTAGKAGSMEFALPPGHPYRDKLPYMRPGLELLQGRYVVWRGRVVSQVGDFYNNLNVTAEGIMAVLNDSAVPPFVYPDDFAEDADYQAAANNGNVVDFLFRWFLAQHNAKASSDQQIKPGVCTVTDANNYIARSSTKYLTTMEAMTTRLTGSALGGYLLMRYESDGNYLDYYADLPLTNAQAVTFGANLLDLERQLTGTGIYTSILPVGKDGLTITELADGDLTDDLVKEGPYIWSRAGVAKYGWICPGPTDWQDVTVAGNLQSYAAARLATSGWALEESITCKAIDLHVTDAAVAAWRVGRYTMLATTPHGIRAAMPLLQMHIDLLDPAQTTVTMGRTRRTFTGDVEDERNRVSQGMEEVRQETEERINTVRQILTERMTQISQSDRQILLEALEQYVEIGDFESYKRAMDATLAILPDQIRMEVSEEITEQVEDATGDIRQSVRTMNQYMSFSAAMGMLLGSEGDPVKVQINNQGLNILRETLALLSINQRGVYTPSLYIRPMDPDDPTAGCLYLGSLVVRVNPDGSVVGAKGVNANG